MDTLYTYLGISKFICKGYYNIAPLMITICLSNYIILYLKNRLSMLAHVMWPGLLIQRTYNAINSVLE